MANQHEDSAIAIEEVVSELHRRGVERGELEYERLVAEARKEAAGIIAEAEASRDSLTEDGRREPFLLSDRQTVRRKGQGLNPKLAVVGW